MILPAASAPRVASVPHRMMMIIGRVIIRIAVLIRMMIITWRFWYRFGEIERNLSFLSVAFDRSSFVL